MKLFRKLLLSLFPKDLLEQGMHPASVFVSFISPKQFFSVITRKIVENYKLNLFDIGLDPFEVKIGFGDQPALQVKDVDFYYGYGAAANMNGRQFYAPSNLAIATCFAVSVLVKDIFVKPNSRYLLSFLLTIYVLLFAFVARIKVFPGTTREENLPRFIDLFFATWESVAEARGRKLSAAKLKSLREQLLQQIHVFFMLMTVFENVNQLFSSPTLTSTELYQRLFYDELKKSKKQVLIQDFVNHAEDYATQPTRTERDHQLMELVLPADILLKYLYTERDTLVVTQKVISQIFDQEYLEECAQSFLKNNDRFEEFMTYICDWRLLRSSYFRGVKNLASQKFRLQQDYAVAQEIDTFMSEIQDIDSLEGVKVPDVLKQESLLMERLLNFYITYIGWSRIGRGDTFFSRLFRRPLLQDFLIKYDKTGLKQDALYFYGGLLYNYSKNVFYYKYAFDNVKAGKEKFSLPFKSNFKEVYSNMYILKLFDENFVNTVFQDINKKQVKIYMSNPAMLTLFKHIVGDRLSIMLREGDTGIMAGVYGPLGGMLGDANDVLQVIGRHLTPWDMTALKENLYTIDMWMRRDALEWYSEKHAAYAALYSDMSVMWLAALLRETIFGMVMLLVYAKKLHQEIDPHLLRLLKKAYIVDVLQMTEEWVVSMSDMIETLVIRYEHLLSSRVLVDDNEKYLEFGLHNWTTYCEGRQDAAILGDLVWEDIIRFRGYLKTITYYNKRYFIPR